MSLSADGGEGGGWSSECGKKRIKSSATEANNGRLLQSARAVHSPPAAAYTAGMHHMKIIASNPPAASCKGSNPRLISIQDRCCKVAVLGVPYFCFCTCITGIVT